MCEGGLHIKLRLCQANDSDRIWGNPELYDESLKWGVKLNNLFPITGLSVHLATPNLCHCPPTHCTLQGCESSSFSWFPRFWKFSGAKISAFSFIFSRFLSFYPDFTLVFLVFCLWPLTPLTLPQYQDLTLGSESINHRGVWNQSSMNKTLDVHHNALMNSYIWPSHSQGTKALNLDIGSLPCALINSLDDVVPYDWLRYVIFRY